METNQTNEQRCFSLCLHYNWTVDQVNGKPQLADWFKTLLEQLGVRRGLIGHEVANTVGQHLQCAIWCDTMASKSPKQQARKLRDIVHKIYEPIWYANQEIPERSTPCLGLDEVATYKRRVSLTVAKRDTLASYCLKDNNVIYYGHWSPEQRVAIPKWKTKAKHREIRGNNFNATVDRRIKEEKPKFLKDLWLICIEVACSMYKRPKPTVASVLSVAYRHKYITGEQMIQYDIDPSLRSDILYFTAPDVPESSDEESLHASDCEFTDDEA